MKLDIKSYDMTDDTGSVCNLGCNLDNFENLLIPIPAPSLLPKNLKDKSELALAMMTSHEFKNLSLVGSFKSASFIEPSSTEKSTQNSIEKSSPNSGEDSIEKSETERKNSENEHLQDSKRNSVASLKGPEFEKIPEKLRDANRIDGNLISSCLIVVLFVGFAISYSVWYHFFKKEPVDIFDSL